MSGVHLRVRHTTGDPIGELLAINFSFQFKLLIAYFYSIEETIDIAPHPKMVPLIARVMIKNNLDDTEIVTVEVEALVAIVAEVAVERQHAVVVTAKKALWKKDKTTDFWKISKNVKKVHFRIITGVFFFRSESTPELFQLLVADVTVR